jgi:hypothetical protein
MASDTAPGSSSAARPAPVVLAAWFAVALGIVWLVALGGGFYGIYGSALRVVSVVMAAIALAARGVATLREPSWRPRSTIWPALAVPLAAFALATLTSERPRMSVECLAYTVVLATLYLLLRTLLAPPARPSAIGSPASRSSSPSGSGSPMLSYAWVAGSTGGMRWARSGCRRCASSSRA